MKKEDHYARLLKKVSIRVFDSVANEYHKYQEQYLNSCKEQGQDQQEAIKEYMDMFNHQKKHYVNVDPLFKDNNIAEEWQNVSIIITANFLAELYNNKTHFKK